MLDSTTKQKINNLRDLLVGKIPNPQGQVQQITLALIYKFMSDIDDETNGIFANASFFPNEFAQYKWTHLMDSKLSAQDRLNLYAEGLEKMNHNPAVPPLFRTIFKQAFLPYRDATTLSNFLKQIDTFHYEHSEDLGDAFEYLLSCLSAAGDAGQFRTPRHIIDFIVDVVQPQITDRVLDPACGTAGFLISAYKHLTKHNKDIDMTKLSEQIIGYDISPDMVQLALVNLYLHQFPDPKIEEYDTLTSETHRADKFDCILANPPFMTPKGGIQPHNKFSITSNRSEVLFVDYIMEHLRSTGKAGIIVPEGVIFQSANAYKALRKMLIEDGGLWAVVSLPAGVFQPYSGVKTSILLLDKTIKIDSITFAKITADGYDLGAQRREISKNDIPTVLEGLLNLKAIIAKNENINDNLTSDLIRTVAKTDLADDYNLSAERYKTGAVAHTGSYEMVELGEVCEINPKKSELGAVEENLEVSFVPMSDLGNDGPEFRLKEIRKLGEVYKGYTYFVEGDVLLARVTPCFENGKAGIASDLKNGIGFGSSEYVVFRPNDLILGKYIYHIITSDRFRNSGKECMTGTGGLQRVPNEFIKNFQIPLPPIEIQKQIVAELDGYQKIIDGAKMVVENWKPMIEVQPEWEMVKLGNITLETKLGLVRNKGEQGIGNYKYLKMDAINERGALDLGKFVTIDAVDKDLVDYGLRDGDFIYNTRNAPNLVGKNTVYHGPDGEYIINNNLLRLRFDENVVISDFVSCFLNQEEGLSQIRSFINGTTSVAALYWKDFSQIKVPLPPLYIQQSIVTRIQHEQSLVDSAKELVQIYEEKVKERVEKVWVG